MNGTAGYQASADLVVFLNGATHLKSRHANLCLIDCCLARPGEGMRRAASEAMRPVPLGGVVHQPYCVRDGLERQSRDP